MAAAAEALNEANLPGLSTARKRIRDDRFREALACRCYRVNAHGGKMALSINDTRIACPIIWNAR